jgi:hypothetical protein
VLLQVFGHNTPAVNHYEGLGFRLLRWALPRWVEDSSRRAAAAATFSDLDPLDYPRGHQ